MAALEGLLEKLKLDTKDGDTTAVNTQFKNELKRTAAVRTEKLKRFRQFLHSMKYDELYPLLPAGTGVCI